MGLVLALPERHTMRTCTGRRATPPVAPSCYVDCTGRRTVDIADLPPRDGLGAGAYFAECAYLEETSIHAFARLAIELEDG